MEELQSTHADGHEEPELVVVDGPGEEEHGSVLPFPIAGIGASAGGLEAFTGLLEKTPVDTGMAFVIISHLPAHYRSLLPEILGRSTRMPVTEIADGMRPEPNRVYVIPSNYRLVLSNGAFRLQQRPERDPMPRPIDIFFRSLAEEQKARALGIVLSGTDSDGSLGLSAIKGNGGFSIVQDERTAKFDEMPRSAIALDHVDLVLSPGEIGAELGRIAEKLQNGAIIPIKEEPPEGEDKRALNRIYALLRGISGVDFDRYKQSTLQRRIARRMVVKKVETLQQYATFLQAHAPEVRELYEDALIGVTRFFRDPEAFEALKTQIFPLLFKDRPPESSIRIWVPGCATGEEVYSIAISLLEYLGSLSVQTPIQIFGTDVSERSIDRARLAVYPHSIALEIPADRLRRYFTKLDRGYQVGKRVRELCIFAKHNLTHDPPYAQLDLISCRNVLIYLGSSAQRNVVSTFHYALKQPGVLLLGQSETIREYSGMFTLIDRRNKIYTSNPGRSRAYLSSLVPAGYPDLTEPARHARELASSVMTDVDLQRATDRIVLARHGPPGVVVNEQKEVVQTRGDTSQYLMLPPGSLGSNVLRMAKEGLGPSLRNALRRAIEDDIPVLVPGVRMQSGSESATVALEVLPVQNLPQKQRHFLVLFVPDNPRVRGLAPDISVAAPPAAREQHRRNIQLQQDLASTKVYLQSLIEERDGKNQELISANEEVQSSNEELQSINEELETAKEELQSSNEELQTVNEELNRKNDLLSQTTGDLTNLLNNITMPVLILGPDLHIRQFTPLAERVLSIRSADLGRHIQEIRLNLRVENLEQLLLEVLDTLATKEIEVEDLQGRWHLLRARPYRTVDNRIDGVVLVLIEVDQIRRAQEELRQSHAFAQAVIESVQVPLAVLDGGLKIRIANKAFLNVSELPLSAVEARVFGELAEGVWGLSGIQPMLAELLERSEEGGGFVLEHEHDGGRRTLLIHAQTILPEGRPGVLIALEDITPRKQAQQLLLREKQRLEGRVQITEDALRRSNEELQRLMASLLEAQEEERRRVARDLHDDLSQKVAVLEMDVEQLEARFAAEAVACPELAGIHLKASELLDDLRRVAHELHPQMLDDLGLAVALERLASEFEAREEMPVRFLSGGLLDGIPRMVASSFYRIAQEALHNISKHAGNSPVIVELRGTRDELHLAIRDEGAGFDVAEARLSGGLGLVSMQERVRHLGGNLSIASKHGEGTMIEAVVPRSGKE